MATTKRGKGKRRRPEALLGNHQRCWLWGRNAVLEVLRAGRWRLSELLLDEGLGLGEREAASALAQRQDAPVRLESAERLTQLCRASQHQGYVAKMLAFPYADSADILRSIEGDAGAARSAKWPLFVLLDRIQDPHNFGAIVRSAEVLGVDAVFIGEEGQSDVTSQVARSSAGGVNRLPIAREADLPGLARRLSEAGVAVLAASEKSGVDCGACDFRRPTALVLGNEGHGIAPELLEQCDARVRVPQSGSIASLNVAAAAAVLFYEAHRQRMEARKS